MTNRDRALTWMKENCSAADGPRFSAAGEDEAPDEPHCDCLDTLTALLNAVDSDATRRSAEIARNLAADLNDGMDPPLAAVIKKALLHAAKKIEETAIVRHKSE